MVPAADFCGLLFAALALAWVVSRPASFQGPGLVNLLAGIGIFALVFCTLSPSDDLLQQELIGPRVQCARLSTFARFSAKRPSPFVWMAVDVTTGFSTVFPQARRVLIKAEQPGTLMQVASSILIHSPPPVLVRL